MAIFHASLKAFSRSRGDSATAAAAYRAGCAIADDRTGLTHDYTRRTGVESVRLLVPTTAPAWARDTATLWNAAEVFETRSNARVARELEVALPVELTGAQRVSLADAIGNVLVERYGVAAMVALHVPDERSDSRNFHAHILFTTRELGEGGFAAKVRSLDDQVEGPKEVKFLRARVAALTNEHLEAAGVMASVDHRSLRAQAHAAESAGDYESAALLTRLPTSHEGKAATAAKRRGESMDRVDENIARRRDNDIVLREHRAKATAAGPTELIAIASAEGRAVVLPAARGRRLPGSARTTSGSALAGPVRVARVRGQDSAVLNAQATLMEQGALVAREEAQTYSDALKRAAEEYRALAEKYVVAARLPAIDVQRLTAHCARDPWCAALMRQSFEKRAALASLRDEVPERRRRYGQAMKRTADERAALSALESTVPSVWRALTRRQWAERRREQRARVAKAEGTERIARAACGPTAASSDEAQLRDLRAEVRRIENERKRLFPTSVREIERIPSTPGLEELEAEVASTLAMTLPSKPRRRRPR